MAHLYTRNQGVAWIGSNGSLVCNLDGYKLIPEKTRQGEPLAQAYQMSGPFEYRGVIDHATNWGECIRNKNIATNSPIDKGAFATILAHMANISYRTGTKVVYDPKTRKVGDKPAADALLKPAYRGEWKFPTV